MGLAGTAADGLKLRLDPHAAVPPFEQVRDGIARQVDSGVLEPGFRLPPVRALAASLDLAANTVARAYKELEAAGVVETRGRAGTFVAGRGVERAARAAATAYVDSARALGLDSEEIVAHVRRAAGEGAPSSAKHIVVAAVALVRAGCVLSVRKHGTDRFMLVGGKLEPGESARDAALRETREEVGLDLTEATLLGEFDSEAANEPGHTLHSTVFWVETDAEPVASAEIAEVRWTPLWAHPDDLAPMLEQHVLPVLRAAELRHRQHAECPGATSDAARER